jgi:hypothetical protein
MKIRDNEERRQTWGVCSVHDGESCVCRFDVCLLTFLLELLDGTLVDTTALVDQVTSGGRLAGVDVADNDHVDVSLVLLGC